MATRQHRADFYRPLGPKLIQAGIPWVSGGQFNIPQAIDLSLPIRGIRLKLSGRCVIGVAPFATVNPEGFLNLVSSIFIQGTNARQKGNITLWNIDLATAWVGAHMFAQNANLFTMSTTGAGGDTSVPLPDTPFPGAAVAVPNHTTGYANNGVVSTIDYQISLDLVFHPNAVQGFGKHADAVPAFLVRNEEWKDSLTVQLNFNTLVGGAVAGALGTGAAGTTIVNTAYNSAAGTPSIDLYSLPIAMGLDLKDQVVPGVYTRVAQPIQAALLTAAGNNVPILNMQKQSTPRVWLKTGTYVAAAPAFTALSDQILTVLGVQVGGNRNVRNVVDYFMHKHEIVSTYQRAAIQGYQLFDFMQSGNPDSAYPGQDLGDGSTLQVIANSPGTATAQGLVVQEQVIQRPGGALYS